jgi:hypothetical protein
VTEPRDRPPFPSVAVRVLVALRFAVVIHAHRFDELAAGFLERRGGDYQTLLGYGRVTLEPVADPEEWRREIRRQARCDRIRVRTWCDQHSAVGAQISPDVSDPAIYRAEVERFYLIERLVMELLGTGHVLAAWLRRGDESITFCTRCNARVYLRTTAPVICDGEAFETDCQGL